MSPSSKDLVEVDASFCILGSLGVAVVPSGELKGRVAGVTDVKTSQIR